MAAVAAAPPGPLALRPLRLGELLDRTLRLYRQNFLTCLGVAALAELPVRLFPLAQPWLARATGLRLPSSPTVNLLGVELVNALLEVVVIAALAPLAAGAPSGVVEAYGRLARAWRPLVDTLVGVALYMLALCVWSVVPLVGWFTGPGMLIVYLSLVAPLAGLALVFEQRAGNHAVRRAWDLTRRRFWPAFGFAFLLSLFTLILVGGPGVVISLVLQRLLLSTGRLPPAAAVIQALTSLLIGTLSLPLSALGKTLLYIDLRVRTEGLDLALAAQPEGHPGSLAEALRASAPAGETSSWFTGADMRRFFGLTAIILVGAVALVAIAASVLIAQGVGRR